MALFSIFDHHSPTRRSEINKGIRGSSYPNWPPLFFSVFDRVLSLSLSLVRMRIDTSSTLLQVGLDEEDSMVNPDPDSRSSASTPVSIRHPEFWLYDGSIVLAVGNTLFRVHQTILANHSEVFADLFTIPQPDGEFMIDGCHVVHLYDDEKDFLDLLKAVYRPEYVVHRKFLKFRV